MTEQELTSVVYELKGEFQSVKNTVDAMDSKLDKLPCISHEMRIDQLDKCMAETHQGQVVKTTANYSLRNTVITACVTAILTALGTLAIVVLTGMH